MTGCHLTPVKVKACIPVPHRTEGVFPILVLIGIEASGGVYLNIVQIFMQLKYTYERRDVHEFIYLIVVMTLYCVLKYGKIFLYPV